MKRDFPQTHFIEEQELFMQQKAICYKKILKLFWTTCNTVVNLKTRSDLNNKVQFGFLTTFFNYLKRVFQC